jgi:hypothetical protein
VEPKPEEPPRKNLIEEEFKEGDDGMLEQEVNLLARNEDLTDYAIEVMEKTLEVIYKSVNEIPLFLRAFLKITYDSLLAGGETKQEC